jgi:hypothetical protein
MTTVGIQSKRGITLCDCTPDHRGALSRLKQLVDSADYDQQTVTCRTVGLLTKSQNCSVQP